MAPARRDTEDLQRRIDELEAEIDAVRRRLADESGENEPHFIDTGTDNHGQPVDNMIAPPG